MKKLFVILLLLAACVTPVDVHDHLPPEKPLPDAGTLIFPVPESAPKMCLKFVSAFCDKTISCFDVPKKKCMEEVLTRHIPCDEARDVDPRQLELCLVGLKRVDCSGKPPRACLDLIGFDSPSLDVDQYKL